MPAHEVALEVVSRRLTAVVAQTTTWAQFPRVWKPLLDEVYAFIAASGAFASSRWQSVMLYKDDRPAVEVGVLAPHEFEGTGRVRQSSLPGGRVATAIHRGAYSDLAKTHRSVHHFAAEQGLELAGPRWEIYGHWVPDAAELETEVHYLLR
jgi:effector-binding domain-containing protein